MKDIGLYIHIPFCKKKCNYCDFVSFANSEEKIEEYINCLICEIKEVAENVKFQFQQKKGDLVNVRSIYIGGGTPSYIDSKYINQILNTIRNSYDFVMAGLIDKQEQFPEITIEINPGTVTEEKLKDYKYSGVNRISIGMQATQNRLLTQLGRIHSYQEFKTTYLLAREIGFNNINIDFMIGLPNQTIENIKESLQKIKKLNPEHVSVYSLIVEENTILSKQIEEGTLKLPEENKEREMYWTVKNFLEENGYNHYEISNFAKPNRESRHNMDCWNQKEYFGYGVAAHSYVDNVRFSNITDLNSYIENYKHNEPEKNFVFHEKENYLDTMKEYLLLGFRKIKGVSKKDFENKFQLPIESIFKLELEELKEKGLILENEDTYYLSDKGIDFANLVFEKFV